MAKGDGYKKARNATNLFRDTLNANTQSSLDELAKTRSMVESLYGGATANAITGSDRKIAAMQRSGGAAGASLEGSSGLQNDLIARLAQLRGGSEMDLLGMFNQIKAGQSQGTGQYAQLVQGNQGLRTNFDWNTAMQLAATTVKAVV